MQLFSPLDFCLVIMFVFCRRHTQLHRGETEGGGHEELPAYENRSVTENIYRSRLGFLCWCCSLWHPSVSKPDRCTEVSWKLNCRWVSAMWRNWARNPRCSKVQTVGHWLMVSVSSNGWVGGWSSGWVVIVWMRTECESEKEEESGANRHHKLFLHFMTHHVTRVYSFMTVTWCLYSLKIITLMKYCLLFDSGQLSSGRGQC